MAAFETTGFKFKPSACVPFRDKEVLDRVRNIGRDDIEKHPNPDYQIRVVPDAEYAAIRISDMLSRILQAREENRNAVLLTGNPNPQYIQLARFINKLKIDCSHLYVFGVDEWADEDGNTCPESWPQSFQRALKSYFYRRIDESLRPPESHFTCPSTRTVNDYGKMIEDLGGADVCYSGPGWSGHIAFIDPDTPEFDAPLEEWKKMGARIVTLHPLTIAQNSLHSSFGFSGDIARVPPKAATIGPAEVLAARHHVDSHTLAIGGTGVSWQRLISRLICHGPVTPAVPSSILQTVRTDVYITESVARPVDPVWEGGY